MFATNVATTAGIRDVAFVNSLGTLKACDAYSGAVIWTVPTLAANNDHGKNGSPAIDPSLTFVYNLGTDEKVHKYNIADGSEVTTTCSAGSFSCWPEVLTIDDTEISKTSLTIGVSPSGTFLYVGTSANGSGGTRGHVTTINLANGAQTVFNAVCSDLTTHIPKGAQGNCATTDAAGVWQRGGVTFDPGTNKLYFGTGDGTYDGVRSWSFSVVALNATGTGAGSAPLDAYTPSSVVAGGRNQDWDMSSTNTLILPKITATGNTYWNYQHLAAQASKDGNLRLINLDNMSGQSPPPGATKQDGEVSTARLTTVGSQTCGASQGPCPVLSPVATWINPGDNTNWVFVNSPSGMNAFRVIEYSNATYFSPMWPSGAGAENGRAGGAFVANGVLYYANGSSTSTGSLPPALHAVNATTGLDSTGAVATVGPTDPGHDTPVVVNGILYYKGVAYWSP